MEMGSFRVEFSEEKICFLCISVHLDFSLFCPLFFYYNFFCVHCLVYLLLSLMMSAFFHLICLILKYRAWIFSLVNSVAHLLLKATFPLSFCIPLLTLINFEATFFLFSSYVL